MHLLFDVSAMLYKNFHGITKSTDDFVDLLNFRFFQDCLRLQELFAARNLYFLFDHKSERLKHYPAYKKNRAKKKALRTPEEKQLHETFQSNVAYLRSLLRGRLGFRNVFRKEGYEADDFIGALVKFAIPKKEHKIIVTADKDLYQLITNTCSVYDVRKNETVTKKAFIQRYGIPPNKFNVVKSLTGDASDNISGIPGIGEQRALAYVRGELEERSTYLKLIEGHQKLIDRNLELITLPYKRLDYDFLGIRRDKTSVEKWQEFCRNPVFRKLQGTVLRGNNNG